MLKNTAALLRNWLPKELHSKNDRAQIENAIGFFQRNLTRAYGKAKGMPWSERASRQYEGYNIHAQTLAKEYGADPARVLQAESALSPNVSSNTSFSITERLLSIIRDAPDHVFDDSMTKAGRSWAGVAKLSRHDLAALQGKKFSELPNFKLKAKWARAYDQVYHDAYVAVITPEGLRGDMERSILGNPRKIGWPSFDQIARGIDALERNSKLEDLFTTAKISNYLMCKIVPTMGNHVVSDTHYTSAAFGNSFPSNHFLVAKNFQGVRDQAGVFGGLYSLIQEATVRAAKEVRMSPKAFQALISTYQREFMSPSAFAKSKAGKAVSLSIRNLWEEANKGTISERQAYGRATKIAERWHKEHGGIKAPEWTRPRRKHESTESRVKFTAQYDEEGILKKLKEAHDRSIAQLRKKWRLDP